MLPIEKVNDFNFVKISLASPSDIRSWSYGEVKKPETINYRTYRAERDGLFCERIFGPERDWECSCGRYKGIKHKGIVCDRCGVKVTHSRVRRKRMGHINVAAPVAHIWFFKAMPSRMGTILNMKTTALERVIYFQDYVVTDAGNTPLKKKQLLSEEDHRAAVEKYGNNFKAEMGAEAIRTLLKAMDLDQSCQDLRRQLDRTTSRQKIRDIIKQLKVLEALRDSENKPEWMVMECIPVIPPDLRPLVLLESGNFATSDLNDLYRRIINRNNRLKKLMDLNAPDVIIRNEKRMLQQSVDALFDNGRCKRPVMGSGNRPLKSLTDMIKGKQGRFRENLLGKRVDYSARSVIVVGPELRLHQCGLPKKIALELFQPFIIRRLKELMYADTIKSAKKMLERKDDKVWDILEEVIKNHPVMLNRAPTLHRMGIQAFEPILVEGNAIKIHPLVCKGFNADFDGDQMAVHLPLSVEAQVEASTLMLSIHNILSPASGEPIISPSQDIVLGCYFLTALLEGEKGEGKAFVDAAEALMAYDERKVGLHAKVKVRIPAARAVYERSGQRKAEAELKRSEPGCILIDTTVGRILFNERLAEGMPFYNFVMDRKALGALIEDSFRFIGKEKTIQLLDEVKETGFQQATLGGLSFSTIDLKMPMRKAGIIEQAEKEVEKVETHYANGAITDGERYNQIIDIWTHATTLISDELVNELKNDRRGGKAYLNPIYMMIQSGARGSKEQLRQLAGMRGLMAKPSGRIIETPIKANFREGLSVLEYFSSTHGARKGLADTALKTADSGYLTRKLADVAQNVVVTLKDCGTLNGITKTAVYKGDQEDVSLARNIVGRTALEAMVHRERNEILAEENQIITSDLAEKIQKLGYYERVRVRSPLTCEAPLGVCAMCYGMDLSTGKAVEEGLAVGIIGAQSIGEPGTQLTMRTFHYGGTVVWNPEKPEIVPRKPGVLKFHNVNVVENQKGEMVVLNRNGEIVLQDEAGEELERYPVAAGAILRFKDGSKVSANQLVAKWDAHMIPILAEKAGRVKFEDIVEGATMRVEKDYITGHLRKVIVEHKGDLHPQIVIADAQNKIQGIFPIPEKANLEVDEGEEVVPGTLLAKTPKEVGRTQDIVGGLPRVTELFEARKPKDPAVISEIDGVVEIGEKRRGKRTIVVTNETGMRKEHMVPHGKHLLVRRGDRVRAGDPLVDGPLVPHDILRISGEETVQQYLLREIQNVYRAQNVSINDKHVEIIVAQMMRKVRIENVGDSEFLPGSVIDRIKFKEANRGILAKGGKPATAKPLLLGITKASLQSESFISAASFQETSKVLTEAALAGRIDRLVGLKENVILGHLIPAGTGFRLHHNGRIQKNFLEAAIEPVAAKLPEPVNN